MRLLSILSKCIDFLQTLGHSSGHRGHTNPSMHWAEMQERTWFNHLKQEFNRHQGCFMLSTFSNTVHLHRPLCDMMLLLLFKGMPILLYLVSNHKEKIL